MSAISETSSSHGRAAFGQFGHELIANASAHAGPFSALVVVEVAVIASITFATPFVGDYSAIVLVPGATIYGTILSVTLTSGVVQAYYDGPGRDTSIP